MTGCCYISPKVDPKNPDRGVIPVIMADTIATYKTTPPESEPILPSNISYSHAGKSSSVDLVRKFHIFDRMAVAMAGEGRWISTALQELKIKIPDLYDTDRPTRWIGDIANRINDEQGRPVLQIIAICWIPDQNRHNYLSFSDPYNVGYFGQCASIGSGDRDIREILTRSERSVGRWPDKSGYWISEMFPSYLNAEKLFSEMSGQSSADWGGFIESAIFIQDSLTWKRCEDESLLFLYAKKNGNGSYSTGIINRCISYGAKGGRILSLIDEGGALTRTQFIMRDFLSHNDTEDHAIEYWKSWAPKRVTLTMYVPDSTEYPLTVKTYPHEPEHFFIRPVGERLGFGLSAHAIEAFSRDVLELRGLTFEPHATDSLIDLPS
jgi:hypothetical protein